MPVTDGENVVMRLLVERARRISLEELGLQTKDLERVRRSMTKSNGMILTVGPTGSGKTTTLYTLMEELNDEKVNIMTIEDPVEYNIDRVQQIQVNTDKDLSFANGLRSLVRQDPDIIMVGEIRDNETAKIAVNAAMTGHLLLSTMHTNDAATTFPRLIEMDIEPFLVSSSVVVVIAQRLVRKICDKCKMSYKLTDEEIKMIRSDAILSRELEAVAEGKDLTNPLFYKGSGCAACGDSGYMGRVGVFEVMEITDSLRPLIMQRSSSGEIDRVAESTGMTSILHDGLLKAVGGITTLDEVLRVTRVNI
jgi:type II secretory ATPase GspE/PulE/Tfp pilus assembly ATPase PilB-like protein